MDSSPLTQLSVKIDSGTRDRLEEKAKAGGTTLSDFVRRALRETVNEESELARVRLRLRGVEAELSALRRDLANAVEALLVAVTSGTRITPEQAKAWVNARLRKS